MLDMLDQRQRRLQPDPTGMGSLVPSAIESSLWGAYKVPLKEQ